MQDIAERIVDVTRRIAEAELRASEHENLLASGGCCEECPTSRQVYLQCLPKLLSCRIFQPCAISDLTHLFR